ncbi:hypothetical protein [Aestuariibius sp. HNIBRBA575]|uniref:hypothetical protein n=1 Tax=Aestuariibius sp. HNIBRBA575 TaxID=3233343 RepID=UPI0034A395BD
MAALLVFMSSSVHALPVSLIGDTINLDFGQTGFGGFLNADAVISDPGVEFVIPLFPQLPVDIDANSISLSFNPGVAGQIGVPTTFFFSDFDNIITSVTLAAGNAADVAGIFFTDDTITLNMHNPLAWSDPTQTFVFDVTASVPMPVVPLPGSLPLSAGVLALGWAGMRKKRRKSAQS